MSDTGEGVKVEMEVDEMRRSKLLESIEVME
jgi:hypothetical protein